MFFVLLQVPRVSKRTSLYLQTYLQGHLSHYRKWKWFSVATVDLHISFIVQPHSLAAPDVPEFKSGEEVDLCLNKALQETLLHGFSNFPHQHASPGKGVWPWETVFD